MEEKISDGSSEMRSAVKTCILSLVWIRLFVLGDVGRQGESHDSSDSVALPPMPFSGRVFWRESEELGS